MRFWTSQQPHKHTQSLLSREKDTVWCAIGKGGFLGRTFLKIMMGIVWPSTQSSTLRWRRRKFVPALRRKRSIDMDTVVFQQDGVPPHCLNRTLKFLRQYSPWERLISRRTNNPWPPYSPDLNPLTIFCEGTWKTEFMKTIRRQQRFAKTTSEEKSDGLHKKCSIEFWTILMFQFLQS